MVYTYNNTSDVKHNRHVSVKFYFYILILIIVAVQLFNCGCESFIVRPERENWFQGNNGKCNYLTKCINENNATINGGTSNGFSNINEKGNRRHNILNGATLYIDKEENGNTTDAAIATTNGGTVNDFSNINEKGNRSHNVINGATPYIDKEENGNTTDAAIATTNGGTVNDFSNIKEEENGGTVD